MTTVVLVLHLILACALVGIVLIQRSEGGGLGIGGGGGMGGLMTGRGTANLLTRTTAVLAASFMVTSMLLAFLGTSKEEPGDVLKKLEDPTTLEEPLVPGEAEAETPSVPMETKTPSVPPSVPMEQ